MKLPPKVWFDSETCGFHGFPVLFQYKYKDGEIVLHEIFYETVNNTLALIERLMESTVVGFNLTFDWFHVAKCYTMLRLYKQRHPELCNYAPNVKLLAACEWEARDGDCCKPAAALDLFLASRKGKYQTLMNRGDIRIRKVPIDLAYPLADELDERLDLPEIYWARQADRTIKWRVYDIDDNPHFKDVVLKFNPAGGLKYLGEHILGLKPEFHFEDIQLPFDAVEYGYAPTAAAVYEKNPEDKAWPDVIEDHIRHWHDNANAREYARFDIVLTETLDHHLEAEANDDDSVLACMVAAVRWHGFELNLPALQALRVEAQKIVEASPINVNSTKEVREYLNEVMDPTERVFIAESTAKRILEEIVDWKEDNPAAAERANTILQVREYQKEIEILDKLLHAKRLHADLKVIGTMSSRMAGAGGINVQGIKREKKVRVCFPLAWNGMSLCGGDGSSYEITLADAVFGDEGLHRDIVSGHKIHATFGTFLFPGKTYAEILASEGTDNDLYTLAKTCVFALLYGGTSFTLHVNSGIPIDIAESAIRQWMELYPDIARVYLDITERFSALVDSEHGGFAWKDPDEYIETAMGFKRSFEVENKVIRVLYDLAMRPPKEWHKLKMKVVRRQKIQTAAGAAQSALYGAAFSVQNSNIRAAGNHLIQSLGSTILKRIQRNMWELQPVGYCPWIVAPLNIHDEIMSPVAKGHEAAVSEVVGESISEMRDEYCPLLGMEWSEDAPNWAACKKGGGMTTHEFKPKEMLAA